MLQNGRSKVFQWVTPPDRNNSARWPKRAFSMIGSPIKGLNVTLPVFQARSRQYIDRAGGLAARFGSRVMHLVRSARNIEPCFYVTIY